MKSVNLHQFCKGYLPILGFLFLLFGSLSVRSQNADNGKKLFKANCVACHKLDKRSVGPALRNVAERRTTEWLQAWISDNNKLRASGDPDAIAIFKEYAGSPMTAFPQFSKENINDIIAYTSTVKTAPPATAAGTSVQAGESNQDNTKYYILFAFLALLVLFNFKLLQTVKGMQNGTTPRTVSEYVSGIWKGFLGNGFLKFLALILVLLLSAFYGFSYLSQVGVDQNYQPIQPIAFSHKIHAGDNKIDCQYCHSSARHSKTSGIPSVNVCMNCHKNISEVAPSTATAEHSKEFYDGEIQKIYDAVGYDADSAKYIKNAVLNPIKWVRIHNLPDFAYFNHSQHVNVAGVKCQKCHGNIEEMEEVYQAKPLTMGWCIDCHRETDVDLKGNEYYANIHKQLADKYGVAKVTEAQMGGMECGKCHY